jgi:hypothetical protein
MAMTESWFGDIMERKYLTTLSFDGILAPLLGGEC